MIRAIFAAALLTAGGIAYAPALQDIVTDYVQKARQTPSIAVAVITPDGVEVATAGGVGCVGSVTSETLFEIGSVTKVFTGVLLAQLAADGLVSLDTMVGELMPGERELDPEVAGITLRELVTHTSGLPRLPEGGNFLWRLIVRPSDPYAGSTPDEIFDAAAAIGAAELETRGHFAYSNLGVALLGRLLEAATGQSYESLLEARVLSPMGLTSTRFTEDLQGDPRLARGHRNNLRVTRNWVLDGYAPAGGLASNLVDMRRFLEAAIRAVPGTPLGDSLTKFWSEADGFQGSGLGWLLTERQGERIIWHNGRTGGYYAFIGFLPERGRGVVMLTNASHDGDEFAVSLLRGDRQLPAARPDWIWLGFTLLFVALAPIVVYTNRQKCLATLAGGATNRSSRLHLLGAATDAAFLLVLTWKLGVWNVLPVWYWWAGLGTGVGLLVTSLPVAAKLPWLPTGQIWRHILQMTGMCVTFFLFLWVAFWL